MDADGDETQLIAKARDGDRGALDVLLTKYEQPIYRFGLRMCGNEDAAREVLQETMLAAFRNLAGFRGEASLSTWLYQIARSFCIKQRRVRPGEELEPELPDPRASPEVQTHARQIGEALAAAIGALPPEQREALVLRDVEGLSAREAAEVLGIDVGALKSRLHRARLAVRHQLAHLVESAEEQPCAELAQELTAYAASEIDQAACDQIEKHLASCPKCSEACDALKRTVSLCKRIPGDRVPEPVRNAVRAAITIALQ